MRFVSVLFVLLPAALAANFNILVGPNDTFSYSPNQVIANIGDTLTFTFLSRNHTVTTTTFSGHVCPPPVGGVGPNAFDSGFVPSASITGATTDPTWVYTVVDTAPHFASCMQDGGTHCRSGMAFSLNPTATQTENQFIINAVES